MRNLICVSVVVALAACGGPDTSPPSDIDNACSILKERPDYSRALRRTERRWRVPVSVQLATIHQESKFIGDARTPRRFFFGIIPMGRISSAYGYSQALDGTWEDYQDDTDSYGARRDDIADATDFMGWYMNKTTQRNGVPKWDARRQYLAYHEGHTGYRRGSYRAKPWLLRVSRKVARRAVRYRRQLRACGR